MSEPVIAREVAEGMIAEWAHTLDTDTPDAPHCLRAIMAGRLDFDGSRFRYSLAAPVTLDSGERFDSLELAEPTGAILRDASRGKRDQMETTFHTLSLMTGKPVGLIERLKMRDLNALGEMLAFFA